MLLHYIDNTVMALYCPNMFAYTRITLEFFSKVFIVRQYHEKMIVIYGFFFSFLQLVVALLVYCIIIFAYNNK